MSKGEYASNKYAGSHPDKTLKGVITLKEEICGPQGPPFNLDR
jgi:hypothetical protein